MNPILNAKQAHMTFVVAEEIKAMADAYTFWDSGERNVRRHHDFPKPSDYCTEYADSGRFTITRRDAARYMLDVIRRAAELLDEFMKESSDG